MFRDEDPKYRAEEAPEPEDGPTDAPNPDDGLPGEECWNHRYYGEKPGDVCYYCGKVVE